MQTQVTGHPTTNSPVALNSGATGHFLGIHADVSNKQPCTTPIIINCADDNQISSTHTAEPNIPALSVLPAAARLAHIFPQMGNISLLSLGQLCDHGCTAVFERNRVTVYFKNEVLLTRTRSRETNYLWYIDTDKPQEPLHHAMQAINQSAKAANLVAFAHASFFSPPMATLKNALHQNYISNFPGLSKQSLNRHPPNLTATVKGRLNRVRKNKQSTKKKIKQEI
jgi:hypothetical protein